MPCRSWYLTPQVKILRKNDGWIRLSPLEPCLNPLQGDHLKAELGHRRPMTGLKL